MRLLIACLLALTVTASAQPLSWSPQWLAFSDHPEKVRESGQLYDGSLIPLNPVRFQYYHLGEMDGDGFLRVALYNPSQTTARVFLRSAQGGPDGNYFAAGHQNNVAYLKAWGEGQGQVVELPPGWTVIAQHPLPRGKVVSATQEMTLLEGDPIHFGLFALTAADAKNGLSLLSDPKDVHARGVYPVADQKVVRSHLAGGPDTFAAFGAVRQRNLWEQKELRGDYGVLYLLEFHLRNEESTGQTVDVLFNPRGGAATGTFWVEGQGLIEVDNTKAYATPKFFGLELGPRESRTLRIWTLPEGASSYPVRIVLSSKHS